MGTLGVAGPLTTSLRGLWVSGLLPPDNGGRYQSGGDPRTDQAKKGDDSDPWAGIPKRLRPDCHSCPRGTLEPAWELHLAQSPQRPHVRQREGTERPWRRGATEMLQVVAATAGVLWTAVVGLLEAARVDTRSSTSPHSWASAPSSSVASRWTTSSRLPSTSTGCAAVRNLCLSSICTESC